MGKKNEECCEAAKRNNGRISSERIYNAFLVSSPTFSRKIRPNPAIAGGYR